MRVTIYRYIDGRETVENIRDTDAIVEDEGMDDAAADLMEAELQTTGRFWLAADRLLVREGR